VQLALDPGVLVGIAVTEGLYLRALRILARRGVRVPTAQKVSFHIAIGLWIVGLVSPLDPLGDDLLAAHMTQHVLIADLAAPFLLVGIRNPVLAFLLPRPALVTLARSGLRRGWRWLRRPVVALPLYIAVLYGWHLGGAFEAATRHPLIHALQHLSFITAAVLVWWPALEPKRRRVPGDLWKVPYVLGTRFLSMFLGMSLVVVRVPVYASVYGAGDRGHGLTAIADQQLAAGIMISVDIVVMVAALCFFFLRAAADGERADAGDSSPRRAPERPVAQG
jgi:cytochrome c oxidase assembly factor CtaG